MSGSTAEQRLSIGCGTVYDIRVAIQPTLTTFWFPHLLKLRCLVCGWVLCEILWWCVILLGLKPASVATTKVTSWVTAKCLQQHVSSAASAWLSKSSGAKSAINALTLGLVLKSYTPLGRPWPSVITARG